MRRSIIRPVNGGRLSADRKGCRRGDDQRPGGDVHGPAGRVSRPLRHRDAIASASQSGDLGARWRLTALLFMLPTILVFTAFSWYPIVKTVLMSLQHTNLVQPPKWVGLENFRNVWNDPLFPIAVRNTAYFAVLALIFGYPLPIIFAVLMSEARRAKGFYSVLAYLPVVIPPVVAVLLWKTFYDASSTGVFNTILGWFGIGPFPWLQSQTMAMPSLVLIHLGQCGSHGDHLPGRPARSQPRPLRGRRGRRAGLWSRSSTTRCPNCGECCWSP